MNSELGRVFEIPKEHQDAIKAGNDTINAHSHAMDHHATAVSKHRQALWNTIQELVPEMDIKKYVYTFDTDTCTVKCVRRTWEDMD